MQEKNIRNLAQIFKSLGDPNRISIIQKLSQEEKCVCELMEEMGLSQPAVSHHLKQLKQAGLVQDRREGKWIFYSVNHREYRDFLDLVNNKLGIAVKSYETEIRTEPRINCGVYGEVKTDV
ncbi:MAG: ArsR/SmtB family transcription factor [Peptococcaceae bacterium]